jgi:hypothetical protein
VLALVPWTILAAQSQPPICQFGKLPAVDAACQSKSIVIGIGGITHTAWLAITSLFAEALKVDLVQLASLVESDRHFALIDT